MLRGSRFGLGVAITLAIAAGEAKAQYYPGYGGYGWGGWGGGGATVPGDMARGLGFYNIGAGAYNEMTAQANSINADTVIRFNNYLWNSQQESNRREYLRMKQRQGLVNDTADSIQRRLRENPTDRDIESGDALNVLLNDITNPRIHSSALRLAKDPVNSDVIDDIPFQNASEAVTLSLNQLTKDAWPLALQDDAFTAERQAWTQAVADALKEDEEGQISAKTLARVRSAATQLRAKLEASPPADALARREAQNYVKTLLGLTRMLENPRVEKALAALEKHPKTTLGGLFGFMHMYNLRFGPATKPEQRAVYQDLYPKVASLRDRIYKDAGIDSAPPAANGHPTDFFQGMHLDHLEGKNPNQ